MSFILFSFFDAEVESVFGVNGRVYARLAGGGLVECDVGTGGSVDVFLLEGGLANARLLNEIVSGVVAVGGMSVGQLHDLLVAFLAEGGTLETFLGSAQFARARTSAGGETAADLGDEAEARYSRGGR